MVITIMTKTDKMMKNEKIALSILKNDDYEHKIETIHINKLYNLMYPCLNLNVSVTYIY